MRKIMRLSPAKRRIQLLKSGFRRLLSTATRSVRSLRWPAVFLFSLFSLLRCDDRFDFLEDENTSPQLSIWREEHGSGDLTTLTDAVKTSIKYNNLPFVFHLSASDQETVLSKANYRFIVGNGYLVQNYQRLSGSVNLIAGEASLAFEPEDHGKVIIEFTVEDDFQKKAVARAELTVFSNLQPVASFAYRFVGAQGPYQYQLDANSSVDRDQDQGGGIQAYHFIVNGSYEITTDQPVVTLNFPGPGPDQREVKLEVVDNDGERSAFFTAVVK